MTRQFGSPSVNPHQSTTVMPPGQLGPGLDLDVAFATREEVGLEQVGDHGRVVQRCAAGAVTLFVVSLEEPEHPRDRVAHRSPQSGEGPDAGLGGERRLSRGLLK